MARLDPVPVAKALVAILPGSIDQADTADRLGPSTSVHQLMHRLVMLESQRLIAGRSGKAAGERTPRRVYVITGEVRRRAGISGSVSRVRL